MIPKIVCFGETLWDIFPDKKVIGGAPLNVALRMYSLGAQVSVISKIGNDPDGSKLINFLKEQGIGIGSIQIDPKLDTGNVQVHLDQNNTASYTITSPVAWDEIQIKQNDIDAITRADAFIFGSLSARSITSETTLNHYLSEAKFKVFDANLRTPFYKLDVVVGLMHQADFIKLNDEELEEIVNYMNLTESSTEQQIRHLSEKTSSNHICVTLGADGAIFYSDGEIFKNPGYQVIVKDTVGAGDSFLASMIFHMLQGSAPQKALNYSCAMGSLVASKSGANALVSGLEIEQLIKR